jgi:hypothetical protein
MKKRNPLKQYKTITKVDTPAPAPGDPEEVSFWLVKISPKLMAEIDERRKGMGHNKKVTVTCMALAYLHATDKGLERAADVLAALKARK